MARHLDQRVGPDPAAWKTLSMDRSHLAYWERRAPNWHVAPPFSPSAEDIAWLEAKAARCATSVVAKPFRALLLGVTPALATMRWPEDTHLVAVDWSAGMIRYVWPGSSIRAPATVVRADWHALPLAKGSIDFALGDACYSAVATLANARLLNAELHRVLRPGGMHCQRCFARPDPPLSVDTLFEDLLAVRVSDFDMFRWMLAMAVHGASESGVDLCDVGRVWREHVPDAAALAARHGWSAEALANLESWGRNGGRFSFPSPRELRELAELAFDLLAYEEPATAYGALFPRLTMRRR